MLTQTDTVKLLLSDLSDQSQIYSIFHAYTYSKSSRGLLPVETLGKLYCIVAKLPGGSSTPSARAFEAIKLQLSAASRKYVEHEAKSFGSLGSLGNAVRSPAAIAAWTKATNGKVTKFEDGSQLSAIAIDAGRVMIAPFQSEAPPVYVMATNMTPSPPPPSPPVLTSQDLEAGRMRLALLKERMNASRIESETPMDQSSDNASGSTVLDEVHAVNTVAAPVVGSTV